MNPPLSIEVLSVHRALSPESATRAHVVVRVRAAKVAAGSRPRLTAVLALDVSGSMEGDPLAQVVRSAQRIAEILPATDRLGIVAFADAAVTVSPLRALDAEGRRETLREVSAVTASGRTNVSAGLSHAAVLFPPREAGERQIVLLMSDGQPNVGTSTPQGLADEVKRMRARDVGVSTLGFGVEHDE